MIDQSTQSSILVSFDAEWEIYRDVSKVVASLLEQALLDEHIQVHSITQRCKSRQSLAKKISKPDKNYQSLGDISDIAAIRVTTYFSDDVDRVSELIERTFKIDVNNSIDKRLVLDPDRFGYQSMHYVAELGDGRYTLIEYKRFFQIKFEIQVRSILQHAWAEIEHDLGYKTAGGIPRDIRRKFSRVAGLLELADAEFVGIRNELRDYASDVPQLIANQPDDVELNAVSLNTLYDGNSAAKNLDLILAEVAKANLRDDSFNDFQFIFERLNKVGISTVGSLESVAKSNSELVRRFATYWIGNNSFVSFGKGIGLFYLLYVLLWKEGNRSAILSYLAEHNIDSPSAQDGVADRILAFKG